MEASTQPVRVLIADEHPVIRGVIRLACESTIGIQVVGESGDGAETLRAATELAPDIVVIDLELPDIDGVEVIRDLRAKGFSGAILVVTERTDGATVLECLRLGVNGFTDKVTAIRTIAGKIRAVARGERRVDADLEQAAVMELGRFARQAREGSEVAASLTPREHEVLEMISRGLTMRQIATRLHISPRTVETHVAKLYRKLAVRTRVQAVARAASLGLIDLR
jgi:DNA-binding NarL/FixJ family response regulator